MDDLISRRAAIEAIEQLNIPEDMCVFEILSHIQLAIGTLPSAQPEQPELITWLLDEIWDDDAWELNCGAFPEILCRKLVKLGYVAVEGDNYVRIDKPTIGN